VCACIGSLSLSLRVIRSVGMGVFFVLFFCFFHATFGLFVLMKLDRKKKGLLGMGWDGMRQGIREKGYLNTGIM